jgi:catechol 2,3-dioxygenase-like lactoylglutathione lyase family enzyme
MELNHVLLYVEDVDAALDFYERRLGFERVAAEQGYARVRVPGGNATVALHAISSEPRPPWNEGIAVYFEIDELDAYCTRLADAGVAFDQQPTDMPWGWRHAYLRDPDGHRLSFYRAGPARLG